VRLATFSVTIACVLSLACDSNPASDVKIVERPATNASPPMDTMPSPKSEVNVYVPGPRFSSEMCAVQPEKSKGPYKFVAKGPCAFEQTGNMSCRGSSDDYYASLLRQGPGDVTISVYLNVETGG
jgi:hypothetical protein